MPRKYNLNQIINLNDQRNFAVGEVATDEAASGVYGIEESEMWIKQKSLFGACNRSVQKQQEKDEESCQFRLGIARKRGGKGYCSQLQERTKHGFTVDKIRPSRHFWKCRNMPITINRNSSSRQY